MKKYNANSGWFNESKRHSLARCGIKTGRKVNYNNIDYLKIIKSDRSKLYDRLYDISNKMTSLGYYSYVSAYDAGLDGVGISRNMFTKNYFIEYRKDGMWYIDDDVKEKDIKMIRDFEKVINAEIYKEE